jgi:hypothetical protein
MWKLIPHRSVNHSRGQPCGDTVTLQRIRLTQVCQIVTYAVHLGNLRAIPMVLAEPDCEFRLPFSRWQCREGTSSLVEARRCTGVLRFRLE